MEEEFKFNESNTESGTNTSEVNKKFTLIIVIAVAVFFGLTVFIIFNLLFNRNKDNDKPVEIETTNKEVRNLYNMVTYTTLGVRNTKFMTNSNVTQSSFTNYEKYDCALSLTKTIDFKETGKTENGLKEYYLEKTKVADYMKKFFGRDVNYSSNSSIEHTYNFQIGNNNTGTLRYDQEESKYKIYFDSNKEEIPDTMENKRYYTNLYKAEKTNSELILYEKIVYTKCSKNSTNTYNCLLYRDYDRTIEIDELKGIEEDSSIRFDEIKESNEIVYTFRQDIDGTYYFYSSQTNE